MSQVYKTAGIEAAKIAGSSAVMDVAALLVLSKVKIAAAQHRLTGSYSQRLVTSKVRGKHGVMDRLVSATDPAAISIEFGHDIPFTYESQDIAKSGRRASTGVTRARHVPGLFIMTKARGML